MLKRMGFFIILFVIIIGISRCDDLMTIDATDTATGTSVYIVGGLSDTAIGTTISGIDVYYPSTNTWRSAVTTIPIPVSFASVAEYNGKIYVIGGYTLGGAISSTVQIYSIATGQWTTGSVIGYTARAHAYASVVYGRIYIFGGVVNSAASTTALAAIATQYYQVSSDSWTSPGLNLTLTDRATLAFNDVIYHFNGRSALTTIALPATTAAFSVSSGAATTAAPIVSPAAKTGVSFALYNPSNGAAKLIMLGGFTTFASTTNYAYSGGSGFVATNLTHYINYPFTGPPAAWVPTSNTFGTGTGFGSAVIIGSTLYYFGGSTTHAAGTVQTTVYSLDISSLPAGTWTTKASMPTGRIGHTALVISQ